nr:hypothetical protein [Bacteroides intestinalis]
MEKEFDFDRIGKRMPYKTPEGFLDDMEVNVWKEVQKELPGTPKRKTFRLRVFAGAVAVAASIALLLVLHPFSPKEQTDSFSRVEQAFANLSQEDQAYMLAVYQEDIFMNE